ncbi:MAG: Gx transporter family protein [Oscillospiraceae bacterium]|jgi:heptaprenyl diphosphate synthase|nr:Gx transporter family protein [Oscillospiraceae bacterium]
MKERAPRKDGPAQRVALFAMMTALAFVLSWIERLFPPISGAVPGIKLGLANVVVLVMLYHRGLGQAFAVALLRVLVMGFVFTNLSTMLYSLAGGLLSLGVMALAKRTGWLGPVGVSVLGGVFHNVGQILLAMLLLRSALLSVYLPALVAVGAGTGMAVGVAAGGALRYLKVLPGPKARKGDAP